MRQAYMRQRTWIEMTAFIVMAVAWKFGLGSLFFSLFIVTTAIDIFFVGWSFSLSFEAGDPDGFMASSVILDTVTLYAGFQVWSPEVIGFYFATFVAFSFFVSHIAGLFDSDGVMTTI